MDRIGLWLWYANLAAMGILIARLAIIGLYRIYPFLFAYFLVNIGGNLAVTQLSFTSDSYALAYMVSQSVLHILAFAAVWEMYRVALATHPGLAGFGRASVWIVALVTVLA